MHVDLGKDKNGNERWAEITDLDDMPRGVETAVHRLIPSAGPDGDTSAFTPALMDRMRDSLIAHLIEAWSFDAPLPKGDPEKIAFVPKGAYRKLREETEAHWEEVGFSSRSASADPTGETSSG